VNHTQISQRLVGLLAFPLGIASAIGLAIALPRVGARTELAIMAVFVSSIAWVRLAERVVPYDIQSQQPDGRDRVVDGTSLAVMMMVADPLLKALWPLLLVAAWALLGEPTPSGFFSGETPLYWKVPVALLMSGLGEYALHRLSHRWKPMWGFHALHHSANRIYWLNGFRSHPINIAWHQLAGYVVLLLAGVDAATVTVVSALAVVVSAFQHANASLSLGPLNYLFSTNALHRWHHDSRPGRSYVNYGTVLSVWDWIFGTFYRNDADRPARAGLEPASEMGVDAQSYWAQFTGPIRWIGRYPGKLTANSKP
jgi:sterol desaturase/sphingolipid hydroxylase (fatty acid hydroxylase superfamily)